MWRVIDDRMLHTRRYSVESAAKQQCAIVDLFSAAFPFQRKL
jgi:hypothetical protein